MIITLIMHYQDGVAEHAVPDDQCRRRAAEMTALVTANAGAQVEADVLARLARYSELARGAHSPNTIAAVRSDTEIFSAWCRKMGVTPLPADPSTVAAFVDAMGQGRAPATVRRYVSSIAHLHRAAELPNPAAAAAVKMSLKRLHREKGRAQAQAAPLNRGTPQVPGLVDAMIANAGEGVRALRNRALLAVAYDSLCRRSELVALTCADLSIGPAGDGTIIVRRSKTDQEGEGAVRYIAGDTVRHVSAWLEASGVSEGPLFRTVRKAGRIGGAMHPGDVARIYKELAVGAGVSAEAASRISGHSTRVGAAQDMVGSERIEMPAIMQAGGWKTPVMVARYAAHLSAKRSGAAKLAVLQNRG